MIRFRICILFCVLLISAYRLRSVSAVELSLKPSKPFDKKTGDNFMIQCKLSNVDDFSLILKSPTWIHVDENGKETPIPTSGRRHIKFNDQATTNLLITNAELQDAGKYRCSAELAGNNLFKEIQVTLYQSIQLIDFEGEQHPTEGDNAEIYCKAFAQPKPEITWFKKQKSLTDDGEDTEIVIDSATFPRYTIKDDGQTLAIAAFDTAVDNGVYKCTINQFESADMKEMNITVVGYVKPEIKHFSNGTEINEGSSGDLSCGATGVPVPRFNWYKGDSPTALTEGDEYSFPELGLLRILKSTPEDAGTYKCEAHNVVNKASATIPVTIFLKPIVPPVKNATAKKEETIEILCAFSGGEPLKAVWMSKDGEVPLEQQQASSDPEATTAENVEPANRYAVLDNDKKTITLHIRKASVEDTGEYQCLVSNKAGSTSQTSYVKVEHKPQIVEHSPATVRAVDSSVLELSCTADGLPLPDWLWYNPSGSIVVDGDGIAVISEDKKKSSLRIAQAAGRYGSYRCSAQNQHGTDERTMEILQIEIPKQPVVEIDGSYPTRAHIIIRNYLGEGESVLPEKLKPNKIELKYMPQEKYSPETSWDDLPVAANYDYDPSSAYDIYKLAPRTSYMLAVRGINEAGSSEWITASYETAKAEAPKAPLFVTPNKTECLTSSCVVEWEVPDDGGSTIIRYILMYNMVPQQMATQQYQSTDSIGSQPSAEVGAAADTASPSATEAPPSADVIGGADQSAESAATAEGGKDYWEKETVGASENKFEIRDLQPKATYRIRVYAVNDVGDSPESADLYIKTREFGIQDIAVAGVNAGAIVAIVIIVVLIIVLIVDVACYYVNQCGLLMCICVNCCGKTPPEVKAKEVAMEEGKATSEDKKPLRDIDEGRADNEEDTPMM